MTQVAQRLEMERGEWPSSDDIATEMGESPEKVRLLMRWAKETTSLEKPMGDDGDAELQDFLEDENLPHAEEVTDVHILKETLGSLLHNLTVREVQILRLRYGLGGTETHTLGQIGEKLGLSRERIRQIERESLAKLRLVGGKHRLEQFL
jgi:RNA polymerase primary sigma factor